MHRFFLEPEYCGGDILLLTEREAKHAVQVLRLRHGETCAVLNGAGEVLTCAVDSTARHSLKLKVLARRRHEAPAVQLTLVQALPKGKLIESILQKATELGAGRIVPIVSERVVPHWREGAASSRVERWRRTAIEAIKQCGSPWLPLVSAPLTFQSAASMQELTEFALVASLQPERRHAREVFGEFIRQHRRRPASVNLWVGPEGDFTPEELAALRAKGAHAISLGSNVLRADTAAMAGLAILQSELEASQP